MNNITIDHFETIFIDLDDTIWDFRTNAYHALYQVFTDNISQNRIDFEKFYALYCPNNIALWEKYGKGEITKRRLTKQRFLYPLQQIGIENKSLARKMNNDFLDRLPEQSALIPYAKEFLDYCMKKGKRLTLLTNGFREVQQKKIKESGLGKYFTHIVISEEVGYLKPDKRVFEYALRLNNTTENNVIMIGDSYTADIQGAINANITAIYLSHHQTEAIATEGNVRIIRSLDELF